MRANVRVGARTRKNRIHIRRMVEKGGLECCKGRRIMSAMLMSKNGTKGGC